MRALTLLGLHCVASVGLAFAVRRFDHLNGDLLWSLTEGIETMPKPRRVSGPVLRISSASSAAIAALLALDALADGRLRRHRRFDRSVPPFADFGDAATVALLTLDLVALANAAAAARHINDLRLLAEYWVERGIIPISARQEVL